jgi:hypothetical protein
MGIKEAHKAKTLVERIVCGRVSKGALETGRCWITQLGVGVANFLCAHEGLEALAKTGNVAVVLGKW